MDFKETYKKYLDGTCTDEEKSFVEAEIEKARLVNDAVISATETQKAPEIQLSRKKKSIKTTLKIIIISVVVFMVVSIIAYSAIYFTTINNAVDNMKVEPKEAKEIALEHTYMYARDHYGYAGSMEMLVADQSLDSRELVFRLPLSKCYYVYEFEFIAGNMEFDVEVNSSTGMPTIVDIDKID